jgi:hypothetical protein
MKNIISQDGFGFSPNFMFVTALILIVFSFTITAQKNYYVSNSGEDSNNGLSESAAWKTIDKVNTEMSRFSPGDIIAFRKGDVFTTATSLRIDVDGTVSKPIVFTNYGTGDLPTLSSTFVPLPYSQENRWGVAQSIIDMRGSDNVVIDGLKFLILGTSYKPESNGIILNGDNVTIQNCVFTGKTENIPQNYSRAKGLAISAHTTKNESYIMDNSFYNLANGLHYTVLGEGTGTLRIPMGRIGRNTFTDIWSETNKEAEPIRIVSSVTPTDYEYNLLIDSNYFTRWGEDAIDLSGAQRVILEYNLFEDPIDYTYSAPTNDMSGGGEASKAGDQGSYGTIWRFNYFKNLKRDINDDSECVGIYTAMSSGMWVYNNFFDNCAYGSTLSPPPTNDRYYEKTFNYYYNTMVNIRIFGIAKWSGVNPVFAKNNVIHTTSYASIDGGVIADYNLYNHAPSDITPGTNDILETDLNKIFADYKNLDYTLVEGSKAINSAERVGNSPDGFEIDAWAYDAVNNRKVPRDNNPDRGAFEFGSNNNFRITSSKPIITVQPINKTITENGTVEFSVSATCDDPIEYSWYRYPWNNETSRILESEVHYSGTKSNTLIITNVDFQNFNGQEYFCGVYNSKDRSNLWINTQVVKLTVIPSDSNGENSHTGLKVFLEGAFRQGKMSSNLVSDKILLLDQPYNIAPWNLEDASSINSLSDKYVDWVIVELRSTPTDTKYRKVGILTNYGKIINSNGQDFSFSNIESGKYFIVIKHRNHLSIMSSKNIPVKDNIKIDYDFTISQDLVFGDHPLIDLKNGYFCMAAGDADANGVINNLDFGVVANNIPKHGYFQGDLDMNGIINVLDYSYINKNILKYSHVPK